MLTILFPPIHFESCNFIGVLLPLLMFLPSPLALHVRNNKLHGFAIALVTGFRIPYLDLNIPSFLVVDAKVAAEQFHHSQ
jgi:hypothetical protein